MNKENCALKLVDEIILYCDARSKKHQIALQRFKMCSCKIWNHILLNVMVMGLIYIYIYIYIYTYISNHFKLGSHTIIKVTLYDITA